MKRDFRILTEIGNLLYKEKNKPDLGLGSSQGLREKDLNKNNLFPLTLHQSPAFVRGAKDQSGKCFNLNLGLGSLTGPMCLLPRKGSFLNQKSYDYLNSVSPKNLRGKLAQVEGGNPQREPVNQYLDKGASIKSNLLFRDVIYQYLKTFSLYNNRQNGILIKYNQYIGYNFNSKNILLRGVEPQTNKSLKLNKNIIIKNGPLLTKDSKINKLIATEINRLKGISGLTGYNRSANNRLIKYSYKLLFYFFKSMYCLISKPVFLFTPDKVTIQLFYFLNIPKFKVFKWYSIFNNKLIRQKWYSNRFNRSLPWAGPFSLGKGKNLDKLSNNNIPYYLDPQNTNNKLKNVLQYSNKEMMKSVKVSWRIKKTLFRLNKKRNKVKHILFNLYKYNLFKVFSLKFKLICEILSNKFKKPVELQLIRIHQPFHDSNILVNLLSLNIKNKKFKTNVQIEKLYAKKAVKNLYDYSNNSVNCIPTFLSGIKIRIGGRLMREPIIPRITTKNFERGASSPGKVNFLDTATITKKNRKGSYTIKISSGQNFF